MNADNLPTLDLVAVHQITEISLFDLGQAVATGEIPAKWAETVRGLIALAEQHPSSHYCADHCRGDCEKGLERRDTIDELNEQLRRLRDAKTSSSEKAGPA